VYGWQHERDLNVSAQQEADASTARSTTPEKLARELRGDLDAIVLKALAKRPLERYRAEVPVGKTQRWPVPGDRQLDVTPQSVKSGAVSFNMRLTRGNVTEVSTNIQARSDNPAVIGGPKHGSGTLIIILWTNPSP